MTLIYVPKKLLKEKLKFAIFAIFTSFPLKIAYFSWFFANLPLINHTCENDQKCANFNFSLINFFGTYIRVILAKFQLSRSIFVGVVFSVNMEKITFKGRKSHFWPKNDQIWGKVKFLLPNLGTTWDKPVSQILGILID